MTVHVVHAKLQYLRCVELEGEAQYECCVYKPQQTNPTDSTFTLFCPTSSLNTKSFYCDICLGHYLILLNIAIFAVLCDTLVSKKMLRHLRAFILKRMRMQRCRGGGGNPRHYLTRWRGYHRLTGLM